MVAEIYRFLVLTLNPTITLVMKKIFKIILFIQVQVLMFMNLNILFNAIFCINENKKG